jgi:hypothetical protein
MIEIWFLLGIQMDRIFKFASIRRTTILNRSRALFRVGVEFAAEALKDPAARLFIHCAAGVHRAPMMTLAVLGAMGWDLEEAMQLIETKRPVADFADVYVQSVADFLAGA